MKYRDEVSITIYYNIVLLLNIFVFWKVGCSSDYVSKIDQILLLLDDLTFSVRALGFSLPEIMLFFKCLL